MAKLILFDKDWTLVKPISGGTFVQHPHDQELLPGVAQKLEQLRGDGWAMAIASNQGGCARFKTTADKIKEGMWLNDDLMGGFKVVDVKAGSPGYVSITFDAEGDIINRSEPQNRLMTVFYKSIDEAIEEMRFAMKLIAPHLDNKTWLTFRGLLCPDDGQRLFAVNAWSPQGEYRQYEATEPLYQTSNPASYRKPGAGMLLEALSYLRFTNVQIEQVVMVGDREEDKQAAESAGFQFYWAKDFFEVTNA